MRDVCKSVVIVAALFIAASVPSAWCVGKSQEAGKDSGTVTVTDLAGRQVTLELPVKKANVNWSASGGAFMTMSALLGTEVADHLASWDDDLQSYGYDMWEEFRSKIPALENVPVVAGIDYGGINMEKLIQSKPDVVIWTLTVGEQARTMAEPILEAAGIPIIYIDYHAQTIENHTKSTRLLGQIFGKEDRAEEIVKFYVDNMNMLNNRLARVSSRPVVYMELTRTGPGTYGNTFASDYMWGAMIVNAGGTNLADGIVKNAAPVNAEIVLAKNPDVIILTGTYWADSHAGSINMGYLANETETQQLIRAYMNRPGWSQLKAIKNNQLYAIHHRLARQMYDVATFAFLAKSIHPDLFADIDPMGMLREYYDRFLPYDLYGVWMTQLK
ncbi:MAG: ABC transporter substrate-binding protein [Clostridiales bacterium]|jgi:iron complex transport system substrate-binding protein|nr:ABC transporter substrate-binding protein [Clostridiales bacterium]